MPQGEQQHQMAAAIGSQRPLQAAQGRQGQPALGALSDLVSSFETVKQKGTFSDLLSAFCI
jgi:hypothetical protein